MMLASMVEVISIITGILSIVAIVIGGIEKMLKSIGKIEKKVNSIDNVQATLEEHTKKLDENSAQLHEVKEWINNQEEIEIQNLKYMINSTYFAYGKTEEIPNEMLQNACECCDIYVDEKKRNHEIAPRCKELWRERNRRAKEEQVRG